MEIIFDRFYRANPSRSRRAEGYGIGLALAQAIVRKHRGSIHAELGGGSVRFIVTLPLVHP